MVLLIVVLLGTDGYEIESKREGGVGKERKKEKQRETEIKCDGEGDRFQVI